MTNSFMVRIVISLSLSLLFGCATSKSTEMKSAPSALKAEKAEQKAALQENPTSKQASSTQVASDIFFTLQVKSIDGLLDQGLKYVKPDLPPPMQAMLHLPLIKAQLFKALHISGMEQAVDFEKSAALVFLDPRIYKGKMASLLIAVPVKDPQLFLSTLAKRATTHEQTPDHNQRFVFDKVAVVLRPTQDYVYIAGEENLLGGTPEVMRPLLSAQLNSSIEFQLKIDRIYERYGALLEKSLKNVQALVKAKKPGAGQDRSFDMLFRWLLYIKGMQ